MTTRNRTALVLAIAGLALAASVIVHLPCTGSWWAPDATTHRLCYNDITALCTGRGMAFPAAPYRDYAFEYPALTAWFVWAVAALSAGGSATGYYLLSMLLLGACGLVAVRCAKALAGARAAVTLAAMPMLVFTAFLNWDLIAVAATLGALLAWRRGRYGPAGALIGLGAAAKLFPALLLVPVAALALRRREPRAALVTAGAAVASWLVVNLPFLIASKFRSGWTLFYAYSRDRGASWGTVWQAVDALRDAPLSIGVRDALVAGLLVAGCGAVVAVTLRARREPDLVPLAFATIGVFVLTGKVWSPQYALWVLPLGVLTAYTWRRPLTWLAAWQLADVVYYVAIWWYLAPRPAFGGTVFLLAAAPRFLALAALVVATLVGVAGDVPALTSRPSPPRSTPAPPAGPAAPPPPRSPSRPERPARRSSPTG